MDSFQQQVREYTKRRTEIDRLVDAGQHVEPCFNCTAPATHRTKNITPAGYHAYQCDEHTPRRPNPLGQPGSLPHVSSGFVRLGVA